MNRIFRGLKARLRLIPLLAIALILFAPRPTLASDATVVNNTKTVLYVRAFGGFNTDKCTGPLVKQLSLNPTAKDIIVLTGGDTFCYAASRSNDPNQAPVYCAIGVTAPITITFDASTPACRPTVPAMQKKQQLKITLRGSARPLHLAANGGGGVSYL